MTTAFTNGQRVITTDGAIGHVIATTMIGNRQHVKIAWDANGEQVWFTAVMLDILGTAVVQCSYILWDEGRTCDKPATHVETETMYGRVVNNHLCDQHHL